MPSPQIHVFKARKMYKARLNVHAHVSMMGYIAPVMTDDIDPQQHHNGNLHRLSVYVHHSLASSSDIGINALSGCASHGLRTIRHMETKKQDNIKMADTKQIQSDQAKNGG